MATGFDGPHIPDYSRPLNLNDIRTLIENDPVLAQYNIISLRAFVKPWVTAITRGVAPHRFILLELRLGDKRLWLQLERKPDSKIALIRGFGRTAARDEGQFLKHHREILVRKGYRQENEYQLDPPHPTLRDLSVVFDVICQQHPRYTLYVRNCWMFSFLIQDLLVWLAEVSHHISPLAPRYQNLALRSRLQLQQIYHMPEPITIVGTLRVLQGDIRFARRTDVISRTIADYELWEAAFDSSSCAHLKRLPALIGNIDTITGDMDGFGYRAEAASIWRQMILVLKRGFDNAPSEYCVHLGVSWEQYGVFLLVCGRQREAQIAEGEAAAHGAALCKAGIATFIISTPAYYRYRQRSLLNFGDCKRACIDAAKFVDYCRHLYLSEGAQHAELLALALLWYRDPLTQMGRTSEADTCLDEAVTLVHPGVIPEGETDLGFHALITPPVVPQHGVHSTTIPQPLRFKHPLHRQFDMFWETDWKDSYDRAITVEARAVMCARDLFQTAPVVHAELLAKTLRHYGNAFHHAENYSAACSVKGEAVRITRELCRRHPSQYLAGLADHLREFGVSLNSMGMYKAACDANAEAVIITRELCRLYPDQHEADLADYLQEYGVSLHSREMYDNACDVKAKAVNITRELCRRHPGGYEAGLAHRLSSYGASLHDAKMYEVACDAHADAVDITRKLCRLHPSKYEASLAVCLREYGISLHCSDMYEAACDAKAEAVNITRKLCKLRPTKYGADLADCLRGYGVSLYSREMYNDVCDANAEAVNITRTLCRLHPGKYEADLADCICSYGISLRDAKMYEAACGAKAEAVNITRQLCDLHPGKYEAEFADYLGSYAISLYDAKMYEAACAADAEAVGITRELCRLHPVKYEAALADRLKSYGNSLCAMKMYEAACVSLAEAIDITRTLCQLHPGKHDAVLAKCFPIYDLLLQISGTACDPNLEVINTPH